MVRFGAVLAAQQQPGVRYVDYDALKLLIASGASPRVFHSKLIVEIDAVNADFQMRMLNGDVTKPTILRAAVLNYLAVLKVNKKFNKCQTKRGGPSHVEQEHLSSSSSSGLSPAVEKELRASSFCSILNDPSIFAVANEASTEFCCLGGTTDEACPVCLEQTTPDLCTRLACNHTFCWACLASCAANGIKKCPVCRAEQSLHPVDIEISVLLDAAGAAGAADAASKYSPGVVLHSREPTAASPFSAAAAVQGETASASPSRAVAMPVATVPSGGADELKVMTWNICGLSFPHVTPPLRLCAGIVLAGRSWHDRFRDVSLMPLEGSSIGRIAQQAAYIRESAADLVLLQEVPGASYVDALMRFLGDDFEACYAYRAPSAFAVLTWLAFTALVASLQLLVLEPVLGVLVEPQLLGLSGGVRGRFVLLVVANALRWRHSIITQFLLGSVAGQLLVLRRKLSPIVGAVGAAGTPSDVDRCGASTAASTAATPGGASFRVVGFDTFEGSAASKPSKGYLDAFFSVRPRGVLQVDVPVVDANGARSSLRVCTTHLPHASKNNALLLALGKRMQSLTNEYATLLLGGDFNPLPTTSYASQFAPLLATGNMPTNRLPETPPPPASDAVKSASKGVPPPAHTLCCGPPDASAICRADGELCTWDLSQPLTRQEVETPRTMQLDFLFFNQVDHPGGAPGHAPHHMTDRVPTTPPSRTPPRSNTPPRGIKRLTSDMRQRQARSVDADRACEDADSHTAEESGAESPSETEWKPSLLPHLPQRGRRGARRKMLRAACTRGRAAALAAARRTVLAPLPEYEEVHLFVDRVVCGRFQSAAARLRLAATAAASPTSESLARCHLEVLHTEIIEPRSFFVAGSPLSDHYGLATTFRVASVA